MVEGGRAVVVSTEGQGKEKERCRKELLWSACSFFRVMGSHSPLPGIVLLGSLPGH